MKFSFKYIVIIALSLFSCVIFLDSLRYKFTNAPETQTIFGKLNDWAATWGADGLFAQSGLFSQYVIGTAELIASALLLIGLLPRFVKFGTLGNLIALAVMTGAISFHLFTPLGIDPNNDGGLLFVMAVCVWFSQLIMLTLRKDVLTGLVKNPFSIFKPVGAAS